MKLFYRGTAYDYNPDRSKLGNTGRPYRPTQVSRSPYTLIYRGLTYHVDPAAPQAESALPKTYELIYRSTVYTINRGDAGRVAIAARPVGTSVGTKAKSLTVPATLPRHYVSRVHQSNMMRNIQHRLDVARERDDQKLIQLLEVEMQQISA